MPKTVSGSLRRAENLTFTFKDRTRP